VVCVSRDFASVRVPIVQGVPLWDIR
jgi:hypothetical protein